MNHPNFFIVGEPKCWTSIIHDYLSNHPDIFMSEPKEPHYFCTDLHQESDNFHWKQFDISSYRNKENYLNLFKDANNHKIAGESSTNYSYSENAAENIYNFNKDAKILFCFREPISFLESWHAQLSKKLIEDIQDFKKALEAEPQRKNHQNIPSLCPNPSLLFYSEMVKFSTHLKRFLEHFPTEQIKIVFYEDFKENNQKTIDEITNFLEIDKISITKKETNTRSALKYPGIYSFFYNNKTKLIARKVFPYFLRKKVSNLIRNLTTTKESQPKMDENTKNNLKKQYKQEVINLNNLLHKYHLTNKDLEEFWWYKEIN